MIPPLYISEGSVSLLLVKSPKGFDPATSLTPVIDSRTIQEVLGRAIHSLSRIGDELYFEPLEEGLALKTVNSSRSAYASFVFAPLFFQHYEVVNITGPFVNRQSNGEEDEQLFRCKIVMKSALTVFKSLASLEKTVEKCKILFSPDHSRLIFQLHCRYGITKTHNLSFQECESLQAVFAKDVCPNVLKVQAKVLVDTVVHFPVTLEEITMAVCSSKIQIRNFIEEETDPLKVMLTELSLSPDEFEFFQVLEEADITFCLKELRGLLSFAESSNLLVNIHFDSAGKPVIFNLEDTVLEVNFVLATLADVSERSQATQKERDAQSQKQSRHSSKAAHYTGDDDFMSDDIDSFMIAMETTTLEEDARGVNDVASNLPVPSVAPPRSPTFPMQSGRRSGANQHTEERFTLPPEEEAEEEEEEEANCHDDAVPGTPPHKKFRSLFFGSVLSQKTSSNKTLLGQEVLVSASDSEEDA
ncbi:cell cycle checkpoint control protein RAD9A [Protopterus annectens]|uniref:cell cycle checkpoint control protein RAD9A n=1 Tax=Protopterus annectens TaxID=7888 RepID=UPI001CFB6CED|nr:cell cycle checkpoint control protein RAD9A [Protopterus annectens]